MKSLTSRLTLWYALVVTLTVAALLLFGRFYLQHSMVEGIDLLNEVEFQEIRARIAEAEPSGDGFVLDAVKKHAELDAALYFFEVEKKNGNLIYKSSNLGGHNLLNFEESERKQTVVHDTIGPLRVSTFEYGDYTVRIASSLNALDVLFDGYERNSALLCSAVFLLSLGLGYALSRLAMRPIASVQRTARRITGSRLSERIPVPNTDDEVAHMSTLLNEMLDRLQAAYEQIKRFTAEASHELRTPLSIIRLQAERLAQSGELSKGERVDAAAEQLEEIARLNKLIDDMLLLAKSDAGAIQLNCKDVNLKSFGDDFSCDAVLLAEEQGIRFEMENHVSGTVHFDPVWMRHVLLNLLSNALKFRIPGASIRLTFEDEHGQFIFRVIDEGTGLPESKLEAVFDRFERIDTGSSSQGNGLGLAICRSIVQQHGGTIHAYNRTDRSGLIVEVRLPEKGSCGERL